MTTQTKPAETNTEKNSIAASFCAFAAQRFKAARDGRCQKPLLKTPRSLHSDIRGTPLKCLIHIEIRVNLTVHLFGKGRLHKPIRVTDSCLVKLRVILTKRQNTQMMSDNKSCVKRKARANGCNTLTA